MKKENNVPAGFKPKISLETFVCVAVLVLLFGYLASVLGGTLLMRTIMNLALDLLINTCFFIMGIAVVMGGLSSLMAEYGIIDLFNTLLSPLMNPLFGLPGAASLGVLSTFLSDNPAILTLAQNVEFKSKFKRYQLPALCNLGTAFGMGMIVITYMGALEIENVGYAVLAGFLGTFVGSIVSTRLMLISTRKFYGATAEDLLSDPTDDIKVDVFKFRKVREGSHFQRIMGALLDGGKSGVDVGMSIIPGVLIICTLVMLLTNNPPPPGELDPEMGVSIFPGVGLIPKIGELLDFILKPLFGFSSSEAVAVPLTALGSAGASLGLIPQLIEKNLVAANDIAVFIAMCMCWSGYLSTHIAMMDSLNSRDLASKAILSHTVGGLAAGIAANLIFKLIMLI